VALALILDKPNAVPQHADAVVRRMTTNTQHTFRPRLYFDVVDDQAKHDLKWVGIWGATTVIFALIGQVTRSAWWIVALVSGAFLYFYGVARFNAWRDRVAQGKRDDESDA
jgi:hypothetical protein